MGCPGCLGTSKFHNYEMADCKEPITVSHFEVEKLPGSGCLRMVTFTLYNKETCKCLSGHCLTVRPLIQVTAQMIINCIVFRGAYGKRFNKDVFTPSQIRWFMKKEEKYGA